MTIDTNELQERYLSALKDRKSWDGLWRECYDMALPNQSRLISKRDSSGQRRTDQIFDGTAMDGVDQLATAILGQVTPPWSPWFALRSGTSLSPEQKQMAQPKLDTISDTILSHIDSSNFAVEIHQCFLELVTVGTACIALHETKVGSPAAFRFEAVPMSDIVLEENEEGRLANVYRPIVMNGSALRARYEVNVKDEDDYTIVESVVSHDGHIDRVVFLIDDEDEPVLLEEERLKANPYIAFRWQKAAGERYGRSPVMKALPDIKTANKVVELILKNASIAVTGIWQADDDGVLNPATIVLEPGTIIPKAVGSQGLKPLEMPGKFDVSQLVLEDLRKRIRAAMLLDRLTQPVGANTATEILERASDNSMLLAAIYGRLQAELLTPLLERAIAVLIRRGEIPFIDIDHQHIVLETRSPVAAIQTQRRLQTLLQWLDAAQKFGPETMAQLDKRKLLGSIAADLGVPADMILPETMNITQE